MNTLNPDFTDLEVRLWDGDDWPERRVSLACTDGKHAVMISPRYADIGQAQANAEEIALRCRYHDRLVELVSDAMEDETEFDTEWDNEARAVLAELSDHSGADR